MAQGEARVIQLLEAQTIQYNVIISELGVIAAKPPNA